MIIELFECVFYHLKTIVIVVEDRLFQALQHQVGEHMGVLQFLLEDFDRIQLLDFDISILGQMLELLLDRRCIIHDLLDNALHMLIQVFAIKDILIRSLCEILSHLGLQMLKIQLIFVYFVQFESLASVVGSTFQESFHLDSLMSTILFDLI